MGKKRYQPEKTSLKCGIQPLFINILSPCVHIKWTQRALNHHRSRVSGGYLKNYRVNLEGINLDRPISYRWALSYGKIGIFWIPTRGPKLVAWWPRGVVVWRRCFLGSFP